MNKVLSTVLVSHNPVQPHLGLIRRHIEPLIMRLLQKNIYLMYRVIQKDELNFVRRLAEEPVPV
jgi:hypothetical protein